MQTQMFEIYRTTLKNAADMMTASLESAQRLQQQQLDALHSAIEEQTKSVRQLSEVRSLDELMALQTRLTGTQMERAVDFWSRFWRATGDNQMALIGQAQNQLGQVGSQMRDATASAAQQAGGAVREASKQAEQQARHQERKSA
jgi:phasin family protein